jgi:hypothetical protein
VPAARGGDRPRRRSEAADDHECTPAVRYARAPRRLLQLRWREAVAQLPAETADANAVLTNGLAQAVTTGDLAGA